MEFVRVIEGYNHLWAVKKPENEYDELTALFEKWFDYKYLLDFFKKNKEDLKNYFHIELLSRAVEDTMEDAEYLEELILEFPYTENLDNLFVPLGMTDLRTACLSREKARNWDRHRHASWCRIYAIRLEPNIYIVTGGTIKLTRTMQEREHSLKELEKLNECKKFLHSNGVFDIDSFVELIND